MLPAIMSAIEDIKAIRSELSGETVILQVYLTDPSVVSRHSQWHYNYDC